MSLETRGDATFAEEGAAADGSPSRKKTPLRINLCVFGWVGGGGRESASDHLC